MTDIAAAPAAAPSAPVAAPSAPAATSPAPNAPSPPTGQQAPPNAAAAPPTPKRDPVPWKTKHKIGEEEHELELDASPFLETYKRKVKLDGREFEVPVEEAYKSYERVRSSMSRFDEAAKARKEAETIKTTMAEREKRIEAALTNPKTALDFVERTLGEDAFLTAITERIRSRLEYEALPPEVRQQRDQMTAAERKLAERERQIADRDRQVAEREKAIAAEREQRINTLAQERQKQMVAEWTPMLESAGLPAKLNGAPNMRLMRMLADTLRSAKASGMPMTLSEGIASVRDEYEAMVGHSVQQRQSQAMEAAQAQPGRGENVTPPAQRQPPARKYQTADEYARELRKTWERR
jgi:hypothetical protein